MATAILPRTRRAAAAPAANTRAPRQRRPAIAVLNPRLAALSPAAWQCRDLRHAWPRDGRGTKVLELKHRGDRCVLADIEMECTGGCGVVRTVTVEPTGTGGMRRVGRPRYAYPPEGYRLAAPKRLDDGTKEILERVTPEEVKFAALTAMYPGIRW